MIVHRMANRSRILFLLLVVLAISGLAMGMIATPSSESHTPHVPGAIVDSDLSVTCSPLGLYGDITALPLVGRLGDSSDNLTFVGTTNGLYVIAPGGKLHHFLRSPFGVKHTALIDDITGDGIREIVIALDGTEVPALRCYDGATWEKRWHFAPTAKIWDNQWLECQQFITNLKVAGDGDSQSLLITSGRCVLSIDAKEGSERWRFTTSAALSRMATLADLNNDGALEAFAGAGDGSLLWLNAETGKALWRTKLPEHREANNSSRPWMFNDIEHLVSDIVVLDEEAGKVAVASGDGSVQLYDLCEKRREWDTLVFEDDPNDYSPSNCVLMSPTADITGDGLGEVLLSKTIYADQYSGYTTTGEVALCDSAGNILWHKGTPTHGASVWQGMAFETSVFEGKPVYLDKTDGMTLVDLKDGESILHTIPLDGINRAGGVIKQPGGGGYLAFSSESDLAAISANGELLWYYPRIKNVATESGIFVGDATEDVLFLAESGFRLYPESEVRILRMMDGATWDVAWSYEVPYSELKGSGGLKGLRVTTDLVGSDNIQDIIGYRGDSVFIFSGKDGTTCTIPGVQPIVSLDVVRNGASGDAFALGTAGGLEIVDTTGAPLWTTTTADWIGDESGSFMVLDDINSDNVSEMAIFSTSHIVVLRSRGNAANFELHHTIQSESGFSIRLPEVIADSDGDGIRELAYLQEGAPQTQEYENVHTHVPPRHLLCIESLEDGQSLLKADLQGTVLGYDLACGDFNADGYTDSAMMVLEWSETHLGRSCLRILSGKDGSVVWEYISYASGYSYSSEGAVFNALPVVNIGDINGDGADDLAFSPAASEPSGSYRQQRLQVLDVAHDTMLKDIAVTSRLHRSSFGDYYTAGSNEVLLRADVDADGHAEVLVRVAEPSMPSYDPDASAIYYGSGSSPRQCMAIVDLDSEHLLSTFTGFDTATLSVFESHQSGTLDAAACGGICCLDIGSSLRVTSPESGASMEPIVGVKWQGPNDGGFSQVFVDGVRNDITNGFESGLFLARGNHTIVVRSIDDCGRISYSPADLGTPLAIKVAPSPWKPVWLVVALFALLAIVLLLFYARLHRTWRARRRAAK